MRELIDFGRPGVLTRRQRLARALLWLAIGGLVALLVDRLLERHFPSPVTLRTPVFEHLGEQHAVFRFDFEWRSARRSCWLVIFRDVQTWRVECSR